MSGMIGKTAMKRIIAVLSLALIVGLVGPAEGGLTLNLDIPFGEADVPQGSPPWLTAFFEDIGPGLVELTLDASNLVGMEYVDGSTGWTFNIADDFFSGDDPFSADHITQTGGLNTDSITVAYDAIKAGGDGFFDIGFQWLTTYGNRFGAPGGDGIAGSEAVFTIDYPGITAWSFF